nr:inositol-3-phosphate synthase [Candidatus Saccharibacteria bacterium]NIV03221.1 inositol-3-phosphate synthase [Calditrichia bacterium]NIV72203.1 inositol-3-phosphate synthase [Calditrichia bacterium]NIV99116.1 inositol-3-phosphate synthase [Candidatus Saccharibacteria bacterium]NIW78125.1 inositol-3-phosphate synthase [Calditrichia bacterium]
MATGLPKVKITPAEGRLGILTPGMGAVATTFIAGVIAVRKGLGKPIGSLTQMGTIRLGKRTEHRVPLIKEFVPLTNLNDIYFGGWDIFEDDAYHSALHAGVLEKELLDKIRPELESIKPWRGVFQRDYVKKLD